MSKQALGRGLGALVPAKPKTATEPAAAPKEKGGDGELIELGLNQIFSGKLQPRKMFREEEIGELAASIKAKGLLQPVVVRKSGERYELIAGERRWRASKVAGLKAIPALVRAATDKDVLEWALVENLQRSDLNPLEEAEGYARLIDEFGLTQEQVAEQVGKSRVAITNALRLRNLGEESKNLLRQGVLSVGHAKALLGLESHEMQDGAAREVIRGGLSVRATERLVQGMLNRKPVRNKVGKTGSVAADWREIEHKIQRVLGTRAKLVGTANKGVIHVEYANGEELERILKQWGVSLEE